MQLWKKIDMVSLNDEQRAILAFRFGGATKRFFKRLDHAPRILAGIGRTRRKRTQKNIAILTNAKFLAPDLAHRLKFDGMRHNRNRELCGARKNIIAKT